jgi:hypothetical protein
LLKEALEEERTRRQGAQGKEPLAGAALSPASWPS